MQKNNAFIVRNDMDVNEQHFYCKKGYGCKWTWETIQRYT